MGDDVQVEGVSVDKPQQLQDHQSKDIGHNKGRLWLTLDLALALPRLPFLSFPNQKIPDSVGFYHCPGTKSLIFCLRDHLTHISPREGWRTV